VAAVRPLLPAARVRLQNLVRAPAVSAALLAGVALVALPSCGVVHRDSASTCPVLHLEQRPGPIPIVLIVNDTTRRDRLGVYGGRAATPAFDRFARENLLFSQAFTEAPWTHPAVATLFTGLYPSQHGVVHSPRQAHGAKVLADGLVTLAEVLHAAGYRTAAFVANPWLDRRFGFDQGFDVYDDSLAAWDRKADDMADAALAWLATVPPGQPFFLYLHTMDSHRPYPALTFDDLQAQAARLSGDHRPVSPYVFQRIGLVVSIEGPNPLATALVSRKITLVEMAYEKGIAQFDHGLGRFLEGLSRSPAGSQAAVIVTADHGEELFERGFGNHGLSLYDTELAIPLAMRLPGVRSDRSPVPCLTGLVDVLPTLCSYLGLTCPSDVAGRSLLGKRRDPSQPRVLYAGGGVVHPHNRAVRDENWKLLWQPDGRIGSSKPSPWSLYHVREDPDELHDLADATDPAARGALDRLRAALDRPLPVPEVGPAKTVEVKGELARQLQALGYLEGGSKSPGSPDRGSPPDHQP
jgi:arylsulfatase A-like enzyme